MDRSICRDTFFLSRKARPALKEDFQTALDLRDTLLAHQKECVGMAANMIGEECRMIIFFDHGLPTVMLNPVLLKKESPYEISEGCLSLSGQRPVKRYQSIKVQWQTEDFKPRIKTFTGFTAQIIQHEMDHLEGILI